MGKTKKREKAHKLWKAIDFEVVSRCYDTHPRKYGAEAAKILHLSYAVLRKIVRLSTNLMLLRQISLNSVRKAFITNLF